MKKHIKQLLAVMLVLGSFASQAQITVNVLPPAKISECQDAELVKIAVTNTGSSAITALTVTLPLQTNMQYVSVGSGTTQVNGSLTSPQVTLATLPLAVGSTDTIRVWVKTICGYSVSLGATSPNITANGTYTQGSAGTFSVNSFAQSRPFIAATPEIVYTLNPTNFTLVPLKDTIEIIGMLTQKNVNSYVRNVYAEFNYTSATQSGYIFVSASDPKLGTLTPVQSGSSIVSGGQKQFFKFNETDFLKLGDMDSFLENGDTIFIKAKFVTTAKGLKGTFDRCYTYSSYNNGSSTLNYVAGFSCTVPSSITNSGQFCRSVATPYNPISASIVVPGDAVSNGFYTIEHGSSALRPGGIDTFWHTIVKNTSTGAETKAGSKGLYNLGTANLYGYNGAGVGLGMGNLDTTYIRPLGVTVQGVFFPFTSFDTMAFKCATVYMDWNTGFQTDFDGPGGLSDLDGDGYFDDIAPGDSINIYVTYLRKPNSQNYSMTPNSQSFFRDKSGNDVTLDGVYGSGYVIANMSSRINVGDNDRTPTYGFAMTNMKPGCALNNSNAFRRYNGYGGRQYNTYFPTLDSTAYSFSTTVTHYITGAMHERMTDVLGKNDSAWYSIHVHGPVGVIYQPMSGWVKDSISPTYTVYKLLVLGSKLDATGGSSTNNYCNVNYQYITGSGASRVPYRLSCDFLSSNGPVCVAMKDVLRFTTYSTLQMYSGPTLIDTLLPPGTTPTVQLDFVRPHSCTVPFSNIYTTLFDIQRTNYGWTDSTKSTPVTSATATTSMKNHIYTGDTMNIMMAGKVATGTYDSVQVILKSTYSNTNAYNRGYYVDYLNLLSTTSLKVYRGGSLTATLTPGTSFTFDSSNLWKFNFTGFTFLPGDSLYFDGYAILKNFATFDPDGEGNTEINGAFYYKTSPGVFEPCFTINKVLYLKRATISWRTDYDQTTLPRTGCNPIYFNLDIGTTLHAMTATEYREYAQIDTVRFVLPVDLDFETDSLSNWPLRIVKNYNWAARRNINLSASNYTYNASTRVLTIVIPPAENKLASNSRTNSTGAAAGVLNTNILIQIPVLPNCKFNQNTLATRIGDTAFSCFGSFNIHNNTARVDNVSLKGIGNYSPFTPDSIFKVAFVTPGGSKVYNATSYRHPYSDIIDNKFLINSYATLYRYAGSFTTVYAYTQNNVQILSTNALNTPNLDGQYLTIQMNDNNPLSAIARTSSNLFYGFRDTLQQIKIDSAWFNGSVIPVFASPDGKYDYANIQQMIKRSAGRDTLRMKIKYTSCAGTVIPTFMIQGCEITTPPYTKTTLDSCNAMLTSTYLPSPIPSTINVTPIESPTGIRNLCDTLTYKVRLKSANLGTADSVELVLIENPLAAGTVNIDASLSSFVFRGTTYPVLAANIRNVAPNLIVYNLNPQLRAIGAKMTASDTALFTLRIRTVCGFIAGSLTGFNVQGTQGCGSSLPTQANALPNSFRINGADARYATSINLSKTVDTACGMTKFKLKIINLGDGTSSTVDTFRSTDTMRIVVPKWYSYNAVSSFTSGTNMPANTTPTTLIRTGDKVLSWPLKAGVVESDSMVFDLSFTPDKDSITCLGVINKIDAYTYNFATVTCNATPCLTPIETGKTSYSHSLSKPSVDMLATSNAKLKCTDSITVTINIQNLSTQELSNNSVIRIYADNNNSGTLNTGDVYITRSTTPILAASATTPVTFSVSSAQYKTGACNYIALFGKDSACICASDTQVLNIVPDLLPDTIYVCSNSGNIPPICNLSGMSYNWSTTSPAVTLTNTSTLSPGYTVISAGSYSLGLGMKPLSGTCVADTETVILKIVSSGGGANAGRDTVVCTHPTNTIQLGAAPLAGNTYSWSPAAGLSSITISNPTLVRSTATVYTKILTVTNTATGCISKDTIIVDVQAGPSASITSSNAPMCGGQSRTLTATPSGGTWSGTGVSGSTFTAPGPGSYKIAYTTVPDVYGCIGSDTQIIVVNPKIAMSAITFAPASVCTGSTTTASSSPTGGTWSVVSGPATINAASGLLSATGSTLVTVRYIHPGTAGASCPDTMTATITPVATPVANITSAVTPMCVNVTRALTGTPAGGTFSIVSGGGSLSGSTLTATAPGTISLKYSVTSSGCTDDTVVSIVVNALPTVSITSSSAAMCPAETRTLVGSPTGGTFTGTGVAAGVFTAPATAGNNTITYTYSDANSCSNTATQTITVNPLVTIGAITFSPATVCSAGGTTTASGTPAGGTWSVVSGSGTINSSSGIITATGTTAIVVRYSHPGVSGSSCPTTIDGTITPTASPVANITSSNAAMCVNATRALTGTPAGGTFTVVSGGGSLTGTTLTATAPGTISLKYSVTSSGCTDDTIVSIVVNALPTVSISSSSAAMCPAETRTLVGSPTGGTFTGTGVAAGVFTAPATAGNNTITYTYSDANSCSNTATQTITVNPLITLSAVTFSKATACANAAANSTASATPAGGSWSIVSGPATINASSGAITATGTGTITVRYSHPGVSGTSCPNAVNGTINGVANPTATPTAGTNPVCNGSSALISAGAAGTATPFTYAWAATGGGTAASHTASPNTNTVYQVTVTDANMCTASGSVTLTITGVTPLVANAGNDREICSGTPTSLGGTPTASGGSGGYTYNWSSAAGAIANPSVTPAATTSYFLTVQSAGCSAFDTVVITVNAKPLIAPSSAPSTICVGSSTTLTAGGSGGTGALNYTWSNNATTTSITVSPTVSTTYTVTVKDAKLCEAVGSIGITVNPLPVVSITSSGGNICQGSTRTLVGSPAGGTFTGTGVSGTTFTASTPGSFSITYSYTNGNGCTNTAMQTIVVDPSPIVSAGSNDTICLGASKVLTGSQVTSLTGVLYEWYVQGSTTPIPPLGTSVTVSPLTTTIYEFVGTKGNCSHKATMNLGVVGKPNLIDDMTACQSATEDVATTWPLTNITANDINTAVIKGGVTYTILSAKHGTASISGANINYQASLNYNGLDTIRVVGTSDSCSGLKDTAIFCVNVASVNDAPVLVNDTSTTPMGVPVSKNLLTNDSDVDHTLTGGSISIVNGPKFGNLSAISPTGELTYTPRPFFVGIDTVEYQVCDGGMPILCRNAFAYFNVTPKILDTVTTTNRNTTTPITVGPALEGKLATTSVTPSKPSGTAVINPMTGAVTITPSTIPFIGKDTFVRIVEVMTTNGLVKDTSFIVIDNPNRGDTLAGTTNRNTPLAFPKLMDVNLKGTALAPVVDPTLTINGDGTVTYTPKPGFVGIDTARIVRCDNLGNCHTMVYIVTVKPDLSDSATLTTQGSPVSVGLPITRYPGQSINTTVLNPTDNGTVVVNPDGSVTYTPNPNFVGRDTLVRQICIYDTASMTNICDTIRTIFTVLPKPLDDKTITAAGTPVTAGKPIATLPGTRTDITKTDPKNGTAVVNPDGTVTYTPKPGFVGSDTVKLTVCVYDSVSMKTVCNTTMVVFHVLPVNPDISTGTNINTPVTAGKPVVRIPGTSTDITKTGPSNGTATINPDGTITYTPKPGFIGKDTVTRIVCVYDSTSKKTICDTVKMYFSVYPTNPDTSVTTISGKPVTAGTPVPSLPGVRTDITLSGPTNGSAIVNPDGTVTYTPRLGFSGVDTIRRIICRYDSIAKTTYCDTSLIIVTVEPELAQIPNYFSPNGDGINDVWNLDGLLARYPNARAMVYNRWGNIVWRSTGPYGRSTSGANLWYGQLEGSQDLVPDGVYYYLLELEDEFKTTKTGFIEIMRQ